MKRNLLTAIWWQRRDLKTAAVFKKPKIEFLFEEKLNSTPNPEETKELSGSLEERRSLVTFCKCPGMDNSTSVPTDLKQIYYKCTNRYCNNRYFHKELRDWHSNRCKICPYCGIKQSRLDNLRRHVTTCTYTQSRIALNEFKCDQCEKKFAHKTNMYRHKRRAH